MYSDIKLYSVLKKESLNLEEEEKKLLKTLLKFPPSHPPSTKTGICYSCEGFIEIWIPIYLKLLLFQFKEIYENPTTMKGANPCPHLTHHWRWLNALLFLLGFVSNQNGLYCTQCLYPSHNTSEVFFRYFLHVSFKKKKSKNYLSNLTLLDLQPQVCSCHVK